MGIFEIIKQLAIPIAIEDAVICLAGIILFGIWLLRTSLGRKSLTASIPRANNMHLFMPFIPLFIWFGAVSATVSITRELLGGLPDWQKALLENLILLAGAIIGIVTIIILVRISFTQKLKGLGLDIRTIPKDLFAAVINLISVWPLVVITIMLTIFFGKLVLGRDFHLQRHEELELITTHTQLSLRVLIAVITIVIVPVFEEMLFRGLFQTMIRSYITGPALCKGPGNNSLLWLSIAISSALFAVVHGDPGHWPALFVLSLCMGYSYEKSGSLFRPIFMHSIFNATSIIAVLNQ